MLHMQLMGVDECDGKSAKKQKTQDEETLTLLSKNEVRAKKIHMRGVTMNRYLKMKELSL